MLVWVIYDISGDRIRGRIAQICKGYGLYRVQKSAFLGDLNKNELDAIALECEELIEESDSVFVFPLCDDCFKKIKLIGEGFDKELVSDKVVTKIF
ncbi:MAG: CRISPR-associated endonuclease Cas2 [Euryarchaeota archaeon]|nr:CRISPR-associated endonuclease Cas2 [Euryarchaeota archaeon]